MQDRYSHILAADSETEMEDWVNTLRQALQSNTDAGQERRNGADMLEPALGKSHTRLTPVSLSAHTDARII